MIGKRKSIELKTTAGNNIGFKAQLGPKEEVPSKIYLMPLRGELNMQVTSPIVF